MSIPDRLEAIRVRLKEDAYRGDVTYLLELLAAEGARSAALEARLERARSQLSAVRYAARIIKPVASDREPDRG